MFARAADRQAVRVDACALACRHVRHLPGLQRGHLHGAALHRHAAGSVRHRDGEMRALHDGGQHRRLHGEVLDVLLLHIERHRAGLLQHGRRQAFARVLRHRHDALRADHHGFSAALEHHARPLGGEHRHAGRDRHAGRHLGAAGVCAGPGVARHFGHRPPLLGRRRCGGQVRQDGEEASRREGPNSDLLHMVNLKPKP